MGWGCAPAAARKRGTCRAQHVSRGPRQGGYGGADATACAAPAPSNSAHARTWPWYHRLCRFPSWPRVQRAPSPPPWQAVLLCAAGRRRRRRCWHDGCNRKAPSAAGNTQTCAPVSSSRCGAMRLVRTPRTWLPCCCCALAVPGCSAASSACAASQASRRLARPASCALTPSSSPAACNGARHVLCVVCVAEHSTACTPWAPDAAAHLRARARRR